MTMDATTADVINKIALAIVAVVAMVIGPVLQWCIAKRQAELQKAIAGRVAADNISAKRQNWIDDLRKDMAEYLTAIARLNELRRPAPDLSREDGRKNFDEMAANSLKAHELGIRIRLRLNPNEALHNTLVELLTELSNVSEDPPPDETKAQKVAAMKAFSEVRDDVIVHMQRILKEEWERVKSGKL